MQICTLTQTHNHASTPPLNFLQAGCPFCRPTNSVKALNATQLITQCRVCPAILKRLHRTWSNCEKLAEWSSYCSITFSFLVIYFILPLEFAALFTMLTSFQSLSLTDLFLRLSHGHALLTHHSYHSLLLHCFTRSLKLSCFTKPSHHPLFSCPGMCSRTLTWTVYFELYWFLF